VGQSTIRWREHISARFLENVKKVHSTDGAFATILENKSVVTWGSPDHGGDSSAVKDELRHVEQIHPAKGGAFAAILADRSVVTWGHPSAGGDSFEIHGFLADFADVDQIQDSVVIWCIRSYPGRQIRCVMGQSRLWWRKLCSGTGARRRQGR